MRKFIFKIIGFTIPMVIFFILGLFLPATPRASKSLLFGALKKDSRLKSTPSPRIIFIGGSNLSFGLNSQTIKDELNLNPINTAIHVNIGLNYMLSNTIQYVKRKDIIILVPEYEHFYWDYNRGTQHLFRTIFDVNPSKIRLLNQIQMLNIVKYIPKYTVSKFKSTEYINVKENMVYGVNSFNQYGDTYTHWELGRKKFKPYSKIRGEFNQSVMERIKEFQAEIEKRNATLLISFPGLQDASYFNMTEQIKKVEAEYIKNGLIVLGSSKRYMIPDKMMFNTPYHLNKNGVDYRTSLLIEDFQKYKRQYAICDICIDK